MSLASRWDKIKFRIEQTCTEVGRKPEEICIVAASKGVPAENIVEAYELGVRHFGENYLQEFERKKPQCPSGATWHFIGRIQSNKAKRIGAAFDWVQTIDNLEQVKRLAKTGINILVEVNIAREPQKAGIFPENLAKFVENLYNLTGVSFRGLMTMGPANRNPAEMRPYFQAMRKLQQGLGIREADVLSMGMSSDFEVAIQEGASHIRIGSALFGPRKSKDGD